MKKVKYRDVVGSSKDKGGRKNKQKGGKKPNNFRNGKKRKSFNLYDLQDKKSNKSKPSFRNYKSKGSDDENDAKRRKIEEPLSNDVDLSSSSSSSDEEEENALQQLISTFKSNKSKINRAIDSSDSSESELDDDNNSISTENSDDSDKDEDVDKIEEIDKSAKDNGELSNIGKNCDTDDEIDLKEDVEDDQEDNEIEDPFTCHLSYDLHDNLVNVMQNIPINYENHIESWPKLGRLQIQLPKCENIPKTTENKLLLEEKTYASLGTVPQKISDKLSAKELYIKQQIVKNVQKNNPSLLNDTNNESKLFNHFQSEVFSIFNNYQDFYYNERSLDNAEDLRFVYCVHAVNHILKTRIKIVHHNGKLAKRNDQDLEFRDQGLVRPKILIVVPFKSSAFKIVDFIIKILFDEDKGGKVINKNRFVEDYTSNELHLPKKNPKPEDFEKIFTGNTSDDFKIGLTVTKKSLKLYAEFYASDIIIASPLGLRRIIGAEGEPDRDHDFLASIELLIMDQTELFLMQNWDHVLHIFNHLHLQPKNSHGTDFSRIRTWSLNGWSKYYRQTLIFSSLSLPEINSIFNKKCANYRGRIKTINPTEFGCISQVVVQLPHVFHKFTGASVAETIDSRFQFFTSKILPQQQDSLMKQTLIYVPNYFDFVRVRNHLKREEISFVQICEYSKEAKVARARDMFYHGDAHFLLYTERFHFFNRIRVKGIRHLVFYQPPNFPHFYYEMCNLMQEANMNRKIGNMSNMTVTVIYSKYDIHQLSQIVGSDRTIKMIESDKKVHMMVTGTD